MRRVRVIAVIPARLASTRFPGKPLVEIEGLPMVEHVRRRALLCRRFAEVVVATCDREIAAVVEGFGGRYLMTSPSHPAATDRVAEAARSLECTHVVNVQGDEVLVLPEDLEAMVRAIEGEPDVPAWNAVTRLEAAADLVDASVVKCVCSASGRLLFCSRDFSWVGQRLAAGWEPIRMVLGILGYSRMVLERYAVLSRTPLEVAEAIDQSRIIEHDIPLRGVEVPRGAPGVNTPQDVEIATRSLREDPAQQATLRAVLRLDPSVPGAVS